jgi:hypothetical protein
MYSSRNTYSWNYEIEDLMERASSIHGEKRRMRTEFWWEREKG